MLSCNALVAFTWISDRTKVGWNGPTNYFINISKNLWQIENIQIFGQYRNVVIVLSCDGIHLNIRISETEVGNYFSHTPSDLETWLLSSFVFCIAGTFLSYHFVCWESVTKWKIRGLGRAAVFCNSRCNTSWCTVVKT